MLFGEMVKKYLELIIIIVSVVIIIFCVIVYKKRHSFSTQNTNRSKPIINKSIEKENVDKEQTLCQ